MSVPLSPIVSLFDTEAQEASHDQWFRAKVEEALHSEKPRVPHDAAMAKVQTMLEERRKAVGWISRCSLIIGSLRGM
ncbi:MAG: stability determinant [Burkholderiales bacterium]|nr:stability determinant [Burkholderiales bacterium]